MIKMTLRQSILKLLKFLHGGGVEWVASKELCDLLPAWDRCLVRNELAKMLDSGMVVRSGERRHYMYQAVKPRLALDNFMPAPHVVGYGAAEGYAL